MKKKVKRKLKWQAIFNTFSVILCLSVGFYYLGRLIYYKIDSTKKEVFDTTFYLRIIEQNDTYELHNSLVKENNTYRFTGKVNNNYVKYKGYNWRIIKINSDNSITMITDDTITSLAFGASLSSNILPYLNKTDVSNTGIFESSLETEDLLNTKICSTTFTKIEDSDCFDYNKDYKIGVLSIADYLEAGSKDSYLNNDTYFWSSNAYDKDKSWFIADDGRISNDEKNSKLGIRPVITIDGKMTVIDGNGTAETPYIIEEKEYKTLSDAYIGNYLSFNNTIWKIVAKDEDKIKIVSEECLKDSDGKCMTSIFSDYSNTINLNRKELMYYLNNTFYNTIKGKENIVAGAFYTGTYSLDTNDYRSVLSKTTNLKIGFLSAADLFAYEIPNTFLLTASPINDLNIYSVSDTNSLYDNIVTQELNIRPALYLKASLNIKKGDGSYVAPFTLGDDTDEEN